MTTTGASYLTLGTLTARDLMSPADETIDADETLHEVVGRFVTGASRHLIVLDRDGRCLGVLGPRHVAQAHQFDLRRDAEIRVGELGCASWIMVGPDDDLRTCAQMLVEHDIDAVPVLDADRRVLGLVTAHDIALAAADVTLHEHPHWEE
jgi:CBS domain-containing protein